MIIVEGHRVLIKPDDIEEKTKGGIYTAPVSQEQEARQKTEGTFVKMGPDAILNFGKNRELKKGDRVAFVQYSGVEIMDGKDRYWISNDEDILAILE